MSNIPDERIKRVYYFPNGMVAVFDQQEQQMPEYQGTIEEVGEKLRRATPPTAIVKR